MVGEGIWKEPNVIQKCHSLFLLTDYLDFSDRVNGSTLLDVSIHVRSPYSGFLPQKQIPKKKNFPDSI